MITLVGLPGSGKSTVGRQLARRFSFSFVDSDRVIERRLGCTIREFFEREGEDRFRDVEQETVAQIVGEPGAAAKVLATGGGTVLRPSNRLVLRQNSHVVYLRATPEDLYRRLRHDQNRPLLQGSDPLQKLRDLYAFRDTLYRETAHFTVDTGRPSVATLTNMIAMQLELAGVVSPASTEPVFTGPGQPGSPPLERD